MELFIPERQPQEIMAAMARLNDLGVRGRDAAYLASATPPREAGTPEMAIYLKEFELMVDPAARASAAEVIGLPGPLPAESATP